MSLVRDTIIRRYLGDMGLCSVFILEVFRSWIKRSLFSGFPGGAVVENPPANAGNTGSSPGLERSHMPRSN